MTIKEELSITIKNLPKSPGVYIFSNKENKIIYIGKAKNIKNRVSSYFKENFISGKIKLLVSQITKIHFVIVNSEQEALILENKLIKENQPKYNVVLKDDKTFPWIIIKDEDFPRIFYSRKISKKEKNIFGPFSSVKMMKQLLNLIHEIYKFRTCNYNLSSKNIENRKFKVCLKYHLSKCDAPCIGEVKNEDYLQKIEMAKNIIKGNLQFVKQYMKKEIEKLSENLKFEDADSLLETLKLFKNYQSKMTVDSLQSFDLDVFNIVEGEEFVFVNFLSVMKGTIVNSYNAEIKKVLNEDLKYLLEHSIYQIRDKFQSTNKQIIIPFELDNTNNNIDLIIPQRGDKMKLLLMSKKNTLKYKEQREKERRDILKHEKLIKQLETVKEDLQLKELPRHIECFDNANISGTTPVASCVVFKNLKPAKKEYRKFDIKTVIGADDFKSMEEVIGRRYKRQKEEKRELPQLIIIDGGKGQLSSAYQSLEALNLHKKIEVRSIAKRLEEVFKIDDELALIIDKKSESLRYIKQLRDEAHRFANTFHKQKRSKNAIKTELTNVNGLGEKTAIKLIKEFGSIDKIKQLSVNELSRVAGEKLAESVYEYFKK